MANADRSAEQFRKMTETPIPKLILSLAAPTILSMLITSIYNLADTFFVGQISTSASGAVGIVSSLMAILQALGFMLGHGSGSIISRSLGSQNTDAATRFASTSFFTALVFGGIITAAGLLTLPDFMMLLGSTETILPHACAYARYILLAAPIMMSSLVMNNILRYEGKASFAMIGLVTGGLLNIALDPLFIFTFGMGVAGAALATSLSQVVSFFLLLNGTRLGGNIRIHWRDYTPTLANFREILRGGVPSLARQSLNSLATVCLNLASGGYGDAAIAAMSIVTRVMMMTVSAIIGFGQGFQPICGFNYGAGLYERVRRAFWFCVRLCFCVLVLVSAAAIALAPQIISLFLAADPQVQEIGTLALRLQCALIPLFAFTCLSNMMLQTMGIAGRATVLAMARQGLFFIPAVWVLEHAFGLLGVQLAQPVADVLSFLLAIPLTLPVLRRLRESEAAKKVSKT